jgi:hypothetical protein
MKLLEELEIWLAAENATNVLLPNDSDLLDRVTVELGEMRCEILHNDSPELFTEYKTLYAALCSVLETRIRKL